MALTEIEFELSARQHELMGYPWLRQGQPLSVLLDAGVLLPDPSIFGWFIVQPEPLTAQLSVVGRGVAAFTGQIKAADLVKSPDGESATVLVDCGVARVRVACAPQPDGFLPFGTWETRYLIGHGPLYGIIEDDYASPIGETSEVTIWHFHRLVLTPGDPHFGKWLTTDDLLPSPFRYDRVIVTARIHRQLV